MDEQAPPLRGYAIALVGTAIWSASAVFISYLTSRFRMPPLVLAFWRDFLVTCALAGTLALFARRLLRLDRRHLPFFVLYGFLLAIFNSLWTISVALNGAAVATVLIYISPAFTAVMIFSFSASAVTMRKGVSLSASSERTLESSSTPSISGMFQSETTN